MGSSAFPAGRALAIPLLACLAVVAAACSSGGGAGHPTVTVTRTVPPSPGASSRPAPGTSSPPAPPAGPAECATADLRLSVGTSQGAAGTIYTNIDFTNESSSACFVEGYPGVSLVSAGSDAGSQIGADAKRDPVTPVRAVTLAPGQTAHAVLGVAEAGNFPASKCNPVTAHWLKVFPPDQFTAAYLRFTTQTCASTSEPTMRITAISAGA